MSRAARTIRVAAGLVRDARGAVLLVRKAGTTAFMQPGGKIEPGEAPAEALAREIAEELGVDVVVRRHLGTFRAPAANEPDHVVDAEVFDVPLDDDDAARVAPAREIAETAWVRPDDGDHLRRLTLAPLTEHHVLPLVGLRPPVDRAVVPPEVGG
ncbi:NUDIX hydrolase [Beutenbergia cavernae DSM 12333]|uniref:NUDIX hydrolase n=1 Tax=Beutenbergia cavernae (strain ATCC BAA-8 / DSM 12333 / CCUG 43141 / JCM 11478 / NBRC 16432 / NCIMB 13614 / HKI 0122) TaxID=471853 RepID=C5C3U0_BEUC1|nr:NUDIX domain-containing protein [Beutenbergia cavernae]ACQ81999.1 NUDIX hydrolase [Beutenbergia cavernae DSM 12333]